MNAMKISFYLVVAGIALFTVPAVAGTREDVLAAMQRCASIADDRTWLDCTYGAQQLMRARLEASAEPGFVLMLGAGRKIASGWAFYDTALARLIRVAESA